MTITSPFADMTSASNFSDIVVFLLSSLVTGPSSSQYHDWLWSYDNFLFLKDWPEVWKSEIPPSGFCPISGDWDELGIPNLARISLIKSYRMLKKSQGYSSYRFWVIKGKTIGGIALIKIPPRLGLIKAVKL